MGADVPGSAQLRRLRDAAGVLPEHAGYEIQASRAKYGDIPPGRFETGDYARAVTRLGHLREIDRRVALRLARQDLLTRQDPPRIWAVMDEAVLHRPYGGPAMLRVQLRWLVEVAELPQVRP